MIRQIQTFLGSGVSKRKVANVMKLSRTTVTKYASGDPEYLAESQRMSFAKLEPFQKEIISLINGKITRMNIYFHIESRGYAGGKTQFYKYCEYLAEMGMVDSPGNLKSDEFCDRQTKLKYHYVTRNQIFKHIWSGEGDIGAEDIEYIKNLFPAVKTLKKCLYDFREIFKAKTKEVLHEYMATYQDCELEPIRRFVKGLQKDTESVTNAVTEEYSNGFVEGTNNKLKMIKRIGYGRCKLPLLRSKIVLSAFF